MATGVKTLTIIDHDVWKYLNLTITLLSRSGEGQLALKIISPFFIIVVIIYRFIYCRCNVGHVSMPLLKPDDNITVYFRKHSIILFFRDLIRNPPFNLLREGVLKCF